MEIKKISIIGSGVMGVGIAAHLANAKIPSILLDIVPKFTDEDAKVGLKENSSRFRNKLSLNAIENVLPTLKPSLIFDIKDAKLIQVGNMEDDISKISECDWIVEALTERLEIKKIVFTKVEQHMKPGAIVSSNTSGLPLKDRLEGRGAEFKKNFIITHFFNPVRYMKLVEVVTSKENKPEVISTMVNFLENTLGKGVVYAKDTPNFIANRIGVYAWMKVLKDALANNYKVEEVDAIVGQALGRPKSAAFKTADMVGLDTIVHVSKNTYEVCTQDEEREVFKIPPALEGMVEKKWLGGKSGQGFYKKKKTPQGKEILSLDLKSLEYNPQEKFRYDSLGAAKNLDEPSEKIKTVINASDCAAALAWRDTSATLVYAANRVPDIADDIVNVDNAMKWGFNWDLGPFETWDIIGVKTIVDRLKKEGSAVPKLAETVLQKGKGAFYIHENGQTSYFDIGTSTYKPVPIKKNILVIKNLKEQKKEIKSNAGASLLDLGDGVLCVEFHTKMNAIDNDIGQILNDAVDLMESNNSYQGLVVGNDGPNFSAGANLMLLWLESQQKNWASIEALVKGFQDVCMRLRYSSKPVVAATFGMALGGGCEVTMACNAARVYGELYMEIGRA